MDITMCVNNVCDIRGTCYRYRATPNEYAQSYARFTSKDSVCSNYIEIQQGDRLIPLEETDSYYLEVAVND